MKTHRFFHPLSLPLTSVLCAGACALAASTAPAAVVTYFDPDAFTAATSDATPYFIPYPDSLDPLPRPYLLGPLGFGTTDHFGRLFLENNYAYGPQVPYLDIVYPFGGSVNLTIDTQVDGLTALSFDLATHNGADIVSLKVNDEAVQTFATAGGAPNSVFIGITDTVPIFRLSFTTTIGSEIDVLDFSTAAAVPEPSAGVLAGAALAGGFCWQRRRRPLAA